jgi:peptide/nickel transport system permease protein
MNRGGFRLWNGMLLTWAALALVGLCWTPHDPQAQAFLGERLSAPSAGHWLGVDGLGRDFLSRLWRGMANTAGLGLTAGGASLLLAAGLLTLERRGGPLARRAVGGVVAIGIAFPTLFLGLLLLVFLPPSPWALTVAAALGAVPFGFRQLRVVWLEQVSSLYAEATRALGGRGWHAFRFSLWPNLRPQIATLAKLLFAFAALELSALSFLGLAGDPDFAELGAILRQNQAYLFQRPTLAILPGAVLAALLLTVQLSSVRPK